MTELYESYLKSVTEWDNKGETQTLITMASDKATAAKVANYLRNNGYSVKVGDEMTWFCQLIITRKNK
jgi:hypothetical protein